MCIDKIDPMNELVEILNRLQGENFEINTPLLTEAVGLAESLYKEQQTLQEEVECLSQIISDIRARDARKKCLCRGLK